jgi:hypothetical protein
MRQIQDPRWVTLRLSRLGLGFNLAALSTAVYVTLDRLPPEVFPLWIRAVAVLLMVSGTVWHIRASFPNRRGAIDAFVLTERSGNDAGLAEPAFVGIRVRLNREPVSGDPHRSDNEMDPMFEGYVCAGAFVTPWFTAIPFRLDGDGRWRKVWPRLLPLWPDSLDAEAFRQVRVRLKWS